MTDNADETRTGAGPFADAETERLWREIFGPDAPAHSWPEDVLGQPPSGPRVQHADIWAGMRQLRAESILRHAQVMHGVTALADQIGASGDEQGAGARGILGQLRTLNAWKERINRLLWIGIGGAAVAAGAATFVWNLLQSHVRVSLIP